MAMVCEVTGKRPLVGHRVSHSNTKVKRRFFPNLRYQRFWCEEENRYVRLRVSARGIRTIQKNGVKAVLDAIRARNKKLSTSR